MPWACDLVRIKVVLIAATEAKVHNCIHIVVGKTIACRKPQSVQ
jgi:hypothetical protein